MSSDISERLGIAVVLVADVRPRVLADVAPRLTRRPASASPAPRDVETFGDDDGGM